MLKKEKLFYFDCEWVPIAKNHNDLQKNYPLLAEVFAHQVEKWKDKDPDLNKGINQLWDEKAHTYPEFCKIITISYGYFNEGNFIIKSLYGENETAILNSFNIILDKVYKAGFVLCGYGIKRFDMPWLSKRMMSNDIKPHLSISLYGKKPWDITVFDLPEVWGQGSISETYTPFEVCCASLGIESSKGEISGIKVKHYYWEGKIEDIKNYCELDVQKTMEVSKKLLELMP